MLKNMRILNKLLIAFMIIIAGMVSISVFGWLTIENMSVVDRSMYDQNLKGINGIGDMIQTFDGLKLAAAEAVNKGDAEGAKDLEAAIGDANMEMNSQILSYQHNIMNDTDQRNLDALKNDFGAFITAARKFAGDIKSGMPVKNGFDELMAAGDKVSKDLAEMRLFAVQQGQIKMDGNVGTGNRSITLMLIAAGILTALAVAVAVAVTLGITKPLKKMVKASNKLALGDTSVELDIKRRDEIGVLAEAFGNVVTSVKKVIEDTRMLLDSAVEGKLSVRADAQRHQGDYRRIVEGINDTLEAVIAPINEAVEVLKELQKGNLQVNVNGEYKGEHAVIKEALNDTINTIKSYIENISDVLGDMAGGDLSVSIDSEYRGDFSGLKDSINNIIKSFNGVISQINSAANEMNSGTKQVSSSSQSISQGATEQAGAIEELTVTISQIAQQTKQNAMNADQANSFVSGAKTDADLGNAKMKEMQKAMAEINAASESISKIIKVIDDIAFQTNILALNAAVEAARAGTHGKGFAVVAEEVRNLAARSANAAKETADLIEGSISKVQAGTKITDETAKALEKIAEITGKAAQLMDEIAHASNEQATAIAQINSGIEQLSVVVQTNSATSEETAAASQQLTGQAEMLREMVGQFKLAAKSETAADEAQNAQYDAPGPEAAPEEPEEIKPEKHVRIALNDTEFGKY